MFHFGDYVLVARPRKVNKLVVYLDWSMACGRPLKARVYGVRLGRGTVVASACGEDATACCRMFRRDGGAEGGDCANLGRTAAHGKRDPTSFVPALLLAAVSDLNPGHLLQKASCLYA